MMAVTRFVAVLAAILVVLIALLAPTPASCEEDDVDIAPPKNGEKDSGSDPEEGKYTRRGYVRMLIKNGRITGNTTEKLYHVEGGLEIYYFDVMISGESAEIDQNDESAIIFGSVFVEDPEYRIDCEKLYIKYKESWLKAEGFVEFNRYKMGIAKVSEGVAKKTRMLTIFKNEKTKVYCSTLEYDWDTEDFSAKGEVKIIQDDFLIEAEEMVYDSARNEYVLKGNVHYTIEKFDWLFDSGVVEEEDIDVARAITKEKATITCDTMIINEKLGILKCYMDEGSEGQVKFAQALRTLECDLLEINDDVKMFTAKGRVRYWQKDGNWLLEGGLIKADEAEGDLLTELDYPMTLITESIIFDYDKRMMETGGETIRLEGREGRSAVASTMTYDDIEKVLTMSGGVVIDSGKEYLYCESLVADTDDKVYEFVGEVDGFFKLEKRDEEEQPEEEVVEGGAEEARE